MGWERFFLARSQNNGIAVKLPRKKLNKGVQMEQLKKVLEIDLDKPEDVDYLYKWAQQAQQKIKELESKLSSQLEPLVSGEAGDIFSDKQYRIIGKAIEKWLTEDTAIYGNTIGKKKGGKSFRDRLKEASQLSR